MPPNPTSDLAATTSFPRGIRVVSLPVDRPLIRIHSTHNAPLWFGPKPGSAPVNRFDSQHHSYRVFYAAETLEGAFVEAILHGRSGARFLTKTFLEKFSWTPVGLKRPLLLVKLYDDGLLFHGTDASITSCSDYAPSRQIAERFHQEVSRVDGIAYRSRHNNGELCYAIFDRARRNTFVPGKATRLQFDAPGIEPLLRRYGVQLDPNQELPAP